RCATAKLTCSPPEWGARHGVINRCGLRPKQAAPQGTCPLPGAGGRVARVRVAELFQRTIDGGVLPLGEVDRSGDRLTLFAQLPKTSDDLGGVRLVITHSFTLSLDVGTALAFIRRW